MTDVIRDLPRDDRPRERLLTHGAETLSDAELLALIIGSGVPGQNAIQLARALLADGIRNLRRRDLETIRGIGPAKAARIVAIYEFAKRMVAERPPDPPALDITALGRKLVSGYAHHLQERLGAAFLDARHRILKQREIYIGTIDTALVSTRDIVRFTLMERATAVIVYHNHPSGDSTPSEADIKFTNKLKQSLAMVEIQLVDHLIIGAHGFQSMQASGLLCS
jgi:DNA repair protein RadC